MAVIQGGNVIKQADKQTPGSGTRKYPNDGAPVAGTTYAGIITPGELVEDLATGDIYEYTEPAGAPTFTRIDTV